MDPLTLTDTADVLVDVDIDRLGLSASEAFVDALTDGVKSRTAEKDRLYEDLNYQLQRRILHAFAFINNNNNIKFLIS